MTLDDLIRQEEETVKAIEREIEEWNLNIRKLALFSDQNILDRAATDKFCDKSIEKCKAKARLHMQNADWLRKYKDFLEVENESKTEGEVI